MIVSRTPFRISFFGGGTDYPAWFKEHGGSVLTTSINKYCYLFCRWLPPFFDYKSRIVWSQIELVKKAEEIQHPVVREVLRFLRIDRGVEVHYVGDLPARTGLGSSSTFTVGLLHALYGLTGRMPSRMQLAQDAIFVEQELLRENVGCQDQVIAAFGQLNRISFLPDGSFHVSPVILQEERRREMQDHLMLLFTGISRYASRIAAEQIRLLPQRVNQQQQLQQMVEQGIQILQGNTPLEDFGRLLHEGWQIKRGLTDRISTPAIDALYETALQAGAIGGKLLGAGGGGFLLLFVRPEDQPRVKEALRGLLHVPFRFDTLGSQIVVYDPDAPGTWEGGIPSFRQEPTETQRFAEEKV